MVRQNLSRGAGGELNFALPNRKQILLANFQDAKYCTQTKVTKDSHDGQVQGVGDKAFIGKLIGMESVLHFPEGPRGAWPCHLSLTQRMVGPGSLI